jgi:hypothetical protein
MLELQSPPTLSFDNQIINIEKSGDIILKKSNGIWTIIDKVNSNEKKPERGGGFKLAFTNNVVLVYATNGTAKENEWYRNKAIFDAETFLYRGNGSIDIIPDTDFSLEKFRDRNVIVYGNATNNKAWSLLLKSSPVQVNAKQISFGSKIFEGNNLGTYFIYPRPDSQTASVGVVAGTGEIGMKSLYPNDYFSGITGFPDLIIFNVDWLRDGVTAIKVAGFFGNDWSVDKGDWSL